MCVYVRICSTSYVYTFFHSKSGNVVFLPKFSFFFHSHTTEWDQRFFIDPNSGIKIFPPHYDMYSLIFPNFIRVLVLALLLFFFLFATPKIIFFSLHLSMLKYWPKFSIFAWLVTLFCSADGAEVLDGVFQQMLRCFLKGHS